MSTIFAWPCEIQFKGIMIKFHLYHYTTCEIVHYFLITYLSIVYSFACTPINTQITLQTNTANKTLILGYEIIFYNVISVEAHRR